MSTHRRGALFVLGGLSAFGPLATDVYLPALPDMAEKLGTSEALAQLTISSCLVGLALGQLLAGPLSDRVGRRTPLLIGVGLFAVTSLMCAFSPSIWVLLVLRFLQGMAGAVGVVLVRAMVRDEYEGSQAARVFSHLMLVMGLAPIIAPVLGGQILRFAPWRGIFVALAVIGLGLLALAYAVLRETLPPTARHSGGMREQGRQLASVTTDRVFVGYAAVAGLTSGTLFSYISMSSFVLREEHGVSPQLFSLIFAVNAVGMVVGGQLNAHTVTRFGPARMLRVGLTLAVFSTIALSVSAAVGLGLVGLLVPLWFAVMSIGMVFPNSTALALSAHGTAAGSASAWLGVSQFLMGAILPPLASIAGTSSVVMGATMAAASLTALCLYVGFVLPRSRRAQARAHPSEAALTTVPTR
jgi:MFS transporter, DHA1 family, multidrug resistance protein